MKFKYLVNLKPGDECYLEPWPISKFANKRKRVRWEGEKFVPEGCCNTQYVLVDLDTGEYLSSMAESYITLKDW